MTGKQYTIVRCKLTPKRISHEGADDIILQDGTYKIFINTKGEIGSVSEDFKELMAYFNHSETVKSSKNPLVHSIEAAVREARNNEKWRHDYMTWQMYGNEKYDEGREKGKIEGKIEGKTETLYELVKKGLITIEIAAEQAGVPVEMFQKNYQLYLQNK